MSIRLALVHIKDMLNMYATKIVIFFKYATKYRKCNFQLSSQVTVCYKEYF